MSFGCILAQWLPIGITDKNISAKANDRINPHTFGVMAASPMDHDSVREMSLSKYSCRVAYTVYHVIGGTITDYWKMARSDILHDNNG